MGDFIKVIEEAKKYKLFISTKVPHSKEIEEQFIEMRVDDPQKANRWLLLKIAEHQISLAKKSRMSEERAWDIIQFWEPYTLSERALLIARDFIAGKAEHLKYLFEDSYLSEASYGEVRKAIDVICNKISNMEI